MPPNSQEVKLRFARRKLAKVMGSLADREAEPQEGEEVEGILVTQNFNSKIVSPKDLPTYTPLRLGSVKSKLHVPFSGQVDTLRLFLNEMFQGVSEDMVGGGVNGGGSIKFGLHDNQVTVTTGKAKGVAIVEWKASPVGDIMADSVIALLMHAQSSAASIRLTSKPCLCQKRNAEGITPDIEEDKDMPEKKRPRQLLRILHDTLLKQFDSIEATYEARKATFEISTDTRLDSVPMEAGKQLNCNVDIEFEEGNDIDAIIKVECIDEKLAKNVQECLKNVAKSLNPV